MKKKYIRTKQFLDTMKNLFGDTLSFPNLNYQNQRTKVSVTCNIHNRTYDAWPSNLVRGKRGCKRCGKHLTRLDFIEESRKKHGVKYSYDNVKFINTTTKVSVTCPIHGDWEVKPISHYYEGSGCPSCALENNHLNKDSFIEKARAVHGNLYDYSDVIISKNTDMVQIKCPIHGRFEQPARAHLAGHRCMKCAHQSQRSTLEEFIEKAKGIHGDTYDYSRAKYVNSKTKLTVMCNTHGPWEVRPCSHIGSKTGCPRCRESFGERKLVVYLEKLGIAYVKEYSFTGSRFRYDFYLPDVKVLIEFHGIQHYKPVELFGGAEGYYDTVCRDLAKAILADGKDIPLLVFNREDLANDKLFDNLKKELRKLDIIS